MTAAVIAVDEDEEDGMEEDTAVDEIEVVEEAVDEDEEAITRHPRLEPFGTWETPCGIMRGN